MTNFHLRKSSIAVNKNKNLFTYFPTCVNLGQDPHVERHRFDANPDLDQDRHQVFLDYFC
jgi:hypothetical protein